MDPDNASMADFICDFCLRIWADDRPMVEGHKGSLICSACLTLAYDELWNRPAGASATRACALCLEKRNENCWTPKPWPPTGKDTVQGLAIDATTPPIACKRCVKQSVVMLERDPDYGWRRPTAS
jgi:hypothetical protein